ncbi:MAG: stage II sporulation protein P [Blautia sp.]|nr:stage II sporulation protein P [Blautia sp.]
MTRVQKVFCVFLCLCFLVVLAVMPEPFSLWKIIENVYRQFPLYYFIEEKTQETWLETDKQTLAQIARENGKYLGQQMQSKNKTEEDNIEEKKEEELKTNLKTDTNSKALTETETTAAAQQAAVLPHPLLDLSPDRLADYDFLLNNFYIVDENTDASAANLNAAQFLAEDFSLSHGPLEPQILIYHSHSQETFADSREGEESDTIVGVGDYLTSLLTEKYGYQVMHIKEAFDMMSGELDRNKAYDYACDYVEKVLEENPSVEVVIDLHRDGVDEDRRLVTEINGKTTAQILFYNGLSYTNTQGQVDYLPNPYIPDNLAFSFQLEYQAALYYPDLYRGIYLAGLRYNLHLRKRSLLLEAGAQTNTVQEVKNAMEPFADILNRVLKGSDKQN